jgi:YgiT-type zinc finger domain-containing protein
MVSRLEDPTMKCGICKHGETARGETTVSVQRGTATIVIKGVPADVCGNCGEPYLDEPTATRVTEIVDQAEKNGTELEVRRYAA